LEKANKMNIQKFPGAALLFLCFFIGSSFSSIHRIKTIQGEDPVVPVKDVFTIAGMGIMVVSKIEAGTIQPGNKLEARGRGDKIYPVTIGKIYINNKEVPSATKGDEVTIQVKAVNTGDIKMGMVISLPGAFETVKLAEAEVSFLSTQDGGATSPIKNNITAEIGLHGTSEFTTLGLINSAVAQPGSRASVTLKFVVPIAAALQEKFTVMVNRKLVGNGTFTKFPDRGQSE
jgi:elongation factor Tu